MKMKKKTKGNLIASLLLALFAFVVFGSQNLGLQQYGVPVEKLISHPILGFLLVCVVAFWLLSRKR